MSGNVFWEYLIYVKFVRFDMRVESEWESKGRCDCSPQISCFLIYTVLVFILKAYLNMMKAIMFPK